MKTFLFRSAAVAVALFLAGLPAGAYAKEKVTENVSADGKTTTWTITEPVITQQQKSYTKITFEEGDAVTVEAGGCDQTGGTGATWKRYVDPQGPNADRLYHGLIRIPGATDSFKPSPTAGKGEMVRLLDLGMKNLSPGQFRGQLVVGDLSKVPEKDRYLRLGFEDDGYGDNGYDGREGFWGEDNGTGDQCKNLGNAYVVVTIQHRVIRPLAGKAAAAKETAKAITPPAKPK